MNLEQEREAIIASTPKPSRYVRMQERRRLRGICRRCKAGSSHAEVLPRAQRQRERTPASRSQAMTDEIRDAFFLLLSMTDEQRGLIFCWFCRGCDRYVGPGDTCHCENDE